MNPTPGFLLRKWYMDCITEQGDVFIGYSANLRWKELTIHYSSVICSDGNSKLRTKISLSKSSIPKQEEDLITWSSSALDLEGTWRSQADPIQRRLLDSPGGRVNWSCLQPRSKVEILLGRERHLIGIGYAEILEVTIKPWHLPISELRWGRFHSASDSCVWIEWRGSHPLSLVFCNGAELPNISVSDKRIGAIEAPISLDLPERKELRSGTLISTSLSSIPGIELVVPSRILHAHECKWRSRGQLSINGSLKGSGWAIHEVVKFEK